MDRKKGARTGSKGSLLIKNSGVNIGFCEGFQKNLDVIFELHHEFRENSSQVSCKEQLQGIGDW